MADQNQDQKPGRTSSQNPQFKTKNESPYTKARLQKYVPGPKDDLYNTIIEAFESTGQDPSSYSRRVVDAMVSEHLKNVATSMSYCNVCGKKPTIFYHGPHNIYKVQCFGKVRRRPPAKLPNTEQLCKVLKGRNLKLIQGEWERLNDGQTASTDPGTSAS